MKICLNRIHVCLKNYLRDGCLIVIKYILYSYVSFQPPTVLQKIFDTAIIHTTMGDIHLKLFGKECPRSAENFCVHSKNGYYNGHIFHRVIKGFMIQTGDPTGKFVLFYNPSVHVFVIKNTLLKAHVT